MFGGPTQGLGDSIVRNTRPKSLFSWNYFSSPRDRQYADQYLSYNVGASRNVRKTKAGRRLQEACVRLVEAFPRGGFDGKQGREGLRHARIWGRAFQVGNRAKASRSEQGDILKKFQDHSGWD